MGCACPIPFFSWRSCPQTQLFTLMIDGRHEECDGPRDLAIHVRTSGSALEY